jgi:hypothetical protein|tara:strand:- start:439 stop:759 length:321 start_codon:yes stop_codon:yes gene_type:complete
MRRINNCELLKLSSELLGLENDETKILRNIEKYKSFIFYKINTKLKIDDQKDFFNFINYLKKFYYYSNKQSKKSITENYFLAIKGILLVEDLIKNYPNELPIKNRK